MPKGAPTDDPTLDQRVIDRVIKFCLETMSGYGLIAIYFFGSREKGTARFESDYDFMAVVSDDAPDEIRLNGSLHQSLLGQLRQQLAAEDGLKDVSVDLMTTRYSIFEGGKDFESKNNFCWNACRGRLVYS